MAEFVDPESGLRFKPKAKPARAYRRTEYDEESGLGGGRGRSALPSLPRSVNTNLAAYDSSIPTNVGGGNAGQAQSTNKDDAAYIPPTPKPTPTPTPDTGRNTTRVSKTGVQQTGTQMGPRVATVAELEALAGGSIRDIFAFHSVNLPTTPSGDNKIHPNNFLINGKQTSVDNMSDEDAFSMAHTMGKTSEFLRGYDGEQGDVSAMLDYAQNNGWSKTGITPQEQAPGGETTKFKDAEAFVGNFGKNIGEKDTGENEKAKPRKVVQGYNGVEFGGEDGPDYSTGKSWADARADLAFLDPSVDSMTALKNIERDKYGMVHTSSGKFGVSDGKAFKFSDEGVKAIKTGNFDPEKAATYVDNDWNKPLSGKTAGGNTEPEENTANPSAVQVPDFASKDTQTAMQEGSEQVQKAQGFAKDWTKKVADAMNSEVEIPGAGGISGGAAFTQAEDWSRNNTNPGESEGGPKEWWQR